MATTHFTHQVPPFDAGSRLRFCLRYGLFVSREVFHRPDRTQDCALPAGIFARGAEFQNVWARMPRPRTAGFSPAGRPFTV
jgi:hypothetical protein